MTILLFTGNLRFSLNTKTSFIELFGKEMKIAVAFLVHITLHGMIGGRLRNKPHLLKQNNMNVKKGSSSFLFLLFFYHLLVVGVCFSFNHHLSVSPTNTSSLSWEGCAMAAAAAAGRRRLQPSDRRVVSDGTVTVCEQRSCRPVPVSQRELDELFTPQIWLKEPNLAHYVTFYIVSCASSIQLKAQIPANYYR